MRWPVPLWVPCVHYEEAGPYAADTCRCCLPPPTHTHAHLFRTACRLQEVYQRRLATLIGSGKDRRGQRGGGGGASVIDVVVAGEVATFRAVERFAAAAIQELPVDVSSMFA
jgi:hypothetical protein